MIKITNGRELATTIQRDGLNNFFEQFEDLEMAKNNRNEAIKALRKVNTKDCRILIKKLSSCKKGNRCNSGACPVCYRLFRKNVINQTIKIQSDMNKLNLVTWQCQKDNVPNEQLIDFTEKDLTRIKNRFYQVFKRLEIPYLLIASFEMVYLPDEKSWRPHFHCITSQENIEHLDNVFRKYLLKNYGTKPTPLNIKKITKDHVYAIGYLFKSSWEQKVVRTGKLNYQSKKLTGNLLVNSLLALDRLAIRKKLFLHKCKSYKKNSRLFFLKTP